MKLSFPNKDNQQQAKMMKTKTIAKGTVSQKNKSYDLWWTSSTFTSWMGFSFQIS